MKKVRIFALIFALLLLCGCGKSGGRGEETVSPGALSVPHYGVYVSLGDSIAAGYGLEGYVEDGRSAPGCFAQMLGEKIGAEEVHDLAVTSSTTSDTIAMLGDPDVRALVASADFITVAIGSNDMLGPGLDLVFDAIGVKNNDEAIDFFNALAATDDTRLLLDTLSSLSDAVKTDSAVESLLSCVETFKTNFPILMDTLREINPSARILVLTFYNPYVDLVMDPFFDFGTTVSFFLDQMNDFLFSFPSLGVDFELADVSSIHWDLTNVQIDLSRNLYNLDPHPNANGHRFIFDQLCLSLNEG